MSILKEAPVEILTCGGGLLGGWGPGQTAGGRRRGVCTSCNH